MASWTSPVPTFTITQTIVGSTTVSNPVLFLKVGGTVYAQGYRITYGTNSSEGYRNIYPAYDSSTGNILIVCQTLAVQADLPAITLSDVGVYVIG